MPEGPSIYLVKESLLFLKGKKITAANGSAKIDMDLLTGKKLLDVKTWGKQLLFCMEDLTVSVHFLMFGTYLINERKKTPLKLRIEFGKDEVNFYTTFVKLLKGDLKDHFDRTSDIMDDQWDPAKARKAVKNSNKKIVDLLLDQETFSGVGNIIKNEVMYRSGIHPLSDAAAIPAPKRAELVRTVRTYVFEFLEGKINGDLSKGWGAYQQKVCKRCKGPIVKLPLGSTKRGTYFCDNCQKKYQLTGSK